MFSNDPNDNKQLGALQNRLYDEKGNQLYYTKSVSFDFEVDGQFCNIFCASDYFIKQKHASKKETKS